MKAHSAPLSLPTEALGQAAASLDTRSGYRNLFGDAPPEECYSGFGQDEEGRRKNRRMFRWLAVRLGRPFDWPDGNIENRRIAAGYTYLAQLVIHDSIHSLADLPDLKYGTTWLRNRRQSRLVLDTIYGAGPAADPLFFQTCPAMAQASGFLRVAGRDNSGPPRDLPRSPCPFTGKQPYSDVLIADARNDDNLIIAQLTVLFHLFHNLIYKDNYQFYKDYSEARTFALTRKVVAAVYRRIVFKDLFEKLLFPPIYRAYFGNPKALLDQDDSRVPLEFAYGAARFGHFMVRSQYQINPVLTAEDQAVKSMLRHTSAGRPWAMPLEPKWLIDWAMLFDKPGSGTALRSRRLGPGMSATLVSNDLFQDAKDPVWRQGDSGGLAYRDLLRGSETGLRSVNSILALLPRSVADASPLVRGGVADPTSIVEWLKADPSGDDPKAVDDYINCIAADIPILLFVMAEAAQTALPAEGIGPGECLGPVGSIILAEFFFREYWRTYALIEADEEAQEAAQRIFGDAAPETMPALIEEISRREDWGNIAPKFW